MRPPPAFLWRREELQLQKRRTAQERSEPDPLFQCIFSAEWVAHSTRENSCTPLVPANRPQASLRNPASIPCKDQNSWSEAPCGKLSLFNAISSMTESYHLPELETIICSESERNRGRDVGKEPAALHYAEVRCNGRRAVRIHV
jgi:hypothetical protein